MAICSFPRFSSTGSITQGETQETRRAGSASFRFNPIPREMGGADYKGTAESSSTNNDAAEETLRESEVLRRKGKNGEHKRKKIHQKYSELFL